METRTNSSHLTTTDKGTIASIFLLTAVMLESYTVRAVIDGENIDRSAFFRNTNMFNVKKWWLISDFQDKEKVLDILSLRDVLAHNHVYSYRVNAETQSENLTDFIVGGDERFEARISNGTFKASSLSSTPNAVGPADLLILVNTVRPSLHYLKTRCSRIGSVDFSFARRGQAKDLWEGILLAANKSIEIQLTG
jgi:hypothetical protein